MNQIILVGHLGKDAEVKQYNGKSKATFSIATKERFKGNDGEFKEATTWHFVECWGYWADKVLQFQLTKGQEVFVVGSIRHNEYVNKEGQKAKHTYIQASRIAPLLKPAKAELAQPKEQSIDDGIPF